MSCNPASRGRDSERMAKRRESIPDWPSPRRRNQIAPDELGDGIEIRRAELIKSASRIKRSKIGYDRKHIVLVEIANHLHHQRAPLASPRAVPEVVELAKHVARGPAGDARKGSEPPQVMAVARGALQRLPRPALSYQRLAFRQAADRHICGECRPRVAALELDQIVWNFEYPTPERLAFIAVLHRPDQTRNVAFRCSVALHYLNALAGPQRGKIGCRRIHLCVGDRLREADHQGRRHAARDGSGASAGLEVSHLLNNVALR